MNMNKDLEKDLFKTHTILNYLNASQQAKFSFLNILSQLGETVNPDELHKTKTVIDKSAAWLQLLWKEEPLFAASWERPETFDSQKALDFLEQLIADLTGLVAKLIGLLASEEEIKATHDTRFLIAAIGRLSYARDNYIRGFVDFGKRFKKTDMVTEYSGMLPGIADELATAHNLLNSYRQDQNQGPGFFSRVRYEAMRLPSSFRMHIHDMRQLVLPYKGIPLSFEAFDVTEERAAGWKQLGVSPVLAGYWEAHFIAPEEASVWGQCGIIDFNLAGLWKIHGFLPKDTKPWLDVKLNPFEAMIWRQSGFGAKAARENIDAGITDPRDAPKPGAPAKPVKKQ